MRKYSTTFQRITGFFLGVAVVTLCGAEVKPIPYAKVIPENEQQAHYQRWMQSFDRFPSHNHRFLSKKDGLAAERFAKPPAPYSHPRIFVRPEDRDALLAKSKTAMGKILMGTINAESEMMKKNKAYQQLLAGQVQGAQDRLIARYMAQDAFRCWLENDKEQGRELIKATLTWVKFRRAMLHKKGEIPVDYNMEAINPLIAKEFSGGKSWQGFTLEVMDGYVLGLIYDYLYNWMTQEERSAVRQLIAEATREHYAIGMGIATPQIHNWHIIHANLGILTLAIEGEEGYDVKVSAWTKQGLGNYYSYGIYESGVLHERGGKNAINAHYAIPFSRRNYDGVIPVKVSRNIMAIPNVKRVVTGYIMQLQTPWRGAMQVYGAWGGNDKPISRFYMDIMAVKYAYPDDPAVDYIWHAAVGDNYKHLRSVKMGGHTFSSLEAMQLLIHGEPYKEGLSLDQKIEALDLPTDFFCPQRLLYVGRSDWSTQALQLFVHAQQNDSAHPRWSHGHFNLNALGRPWTYYPKVADSGSDFGHSADAENYSLVLVNGVGPGEILVSGKAYTSNEYGSFVTVDTGPSYSYMFYNQGQHADLVPESLFTDNRSLQELNPLYVPSRSIPGYQCPNVERPVWTIVGNIKPAGDPAEQIKWAPRCPVDYAYRTAGLIKGGKEGGHPYILIVDDISKDGGMSLYHWQFILQPDLEIESQTDSQIILKEVSGKRRMLVCAFDIAGGKKGLGYIEDFPGGGWSDRAFEREHGKRLIIPSYATTPNYKVILVPFEEGDELPKVLFENDKAVVEWSNQKDIIRFNKMASGLSGISIQRGRTTIFNVNDTKGE